MSLSGAFINHGGLKSCNFLYLGSGESVLTCPFDFGAHLADAYPDYELALLDLIGEADIKFSGNPNELVASYAADG